MQNQCAKTRMSSALIRTIDGRINLLGCSGDFPFPKFALPASGSSCPTGTGAFYIYSRGIKVFKGEVPLEKWINPDHLAEKPCVLREHSLELVGQILTLLEIEDTAE